jgi:hypothetical protein
VFLQTSLQAFAGVSDAIRADPYLHPHFRHYMREVRAVAYTQVSQGLSTMGPAAVQVTGP